MRSSNRHAALVLSVLGVAVASCGDTGATKSADPAPPPFAQDTFGKCAWKQVTGAKASIWSYDCGPDAGDTRLVADETIPGFALQTSNGDGALKKPVIRLFKKDANAAIDSIVDQVRAASPGPHTATCTLTAYASASASGAPKFQFTPESAAAAAWEKYQTDGAGSLEPPCGPLGPQFVGDAYFQVLDGDPTTVVYVDLGSEIQVFDVTTLKAVVK